ncbi:CPBP family intramembrane glutamic endopeptidase [Pseudomonas sp. MWU13-3659]|uniref:CPBP family intramembrane glutamic endopeptidase n=1 Tax=Pseudomonas sp. MWU13-3659 TaxID=2986964 RepID=UPI00207504B0
MHAATTPNPAFASQPDYHLFKRIGLLLLAIALYVLGNMLAGVQAALQSATFTLDNQTLMLGIGYAGIALLLLFCLQNRKQGIVRTFAGHSFRRPLLNGVLAIVAAYALCIASMKAFDIPEEPFMVTFFDGLDKRQIILLSLSVALFPPLTEELLFRHFLIRLLPWERGQLLKYTAILGSALLFAAIHSQYQNLITLVLMFAVGVILAVTRIASGGLLVPMLVHASASVTALACHALFQATR